MLTLPTLLSSARSSKLARARLARTRLARTKWVLVALAVSAVAVAGCGDDQDGSASPASATATAMPTGSIRGDRYCEFLLVTPTGAGAVAEVYATFPLNDCPAEVWDAADTTEVAASAGVPLAIANGPRYWLIDAVSRTTTDDVVRRELGGLAMNRYATVAIADLQLARQRYTAQSVDRRAIMTFAAGSEIYVLVAPDGNQYVMQSYSQQEDAGLTEADLATLGDRLALPDGWRYEARTLDADLVIDFGDQPARVLQDELQNSYSQIPVTN
jgi:hypothetical protein